MRHITIASTVVLIGLLANTSMAAAGPRHKTKPKCSPVHEKVIATNTQAVVYETPEAKERLSNISACVYGHRPYVLGPKAAGGPGGSFGIEGETLAGPIVAYEESSDFTEGHSRNVIVVRDLRTGRVIYKVPTAEAKTPGDVGKGQASEIIVKNDGAVAWVVQTEREPTVYEVWAVDKTGSRMLASSGDVEPYSLALAGSTLYWTQGGKPMSATLN